MYGRKIIVERSVQELHVEFDCGVARVDITLCWKFQTDDTARIKLRGVLWRDSRSHLDGFVGLGWETESGIPRYNDIAA